MYGTTWPELRIDPVSALVWPSIEFIGKPNQRINKQEQIQGHIEAPSYSWPCFLGCFFLGAKCSRGRHGRARSTVCKLHYQWEKPTEAERRRAKACVLNKTSRDHFHVQSPSAAAGETPKNWISVASAADVFTDQAVGTVESMQPWWRWRVVVEVEGGG